MGIVKVEELMEEFNKRGFHYGKDLLFNYYISLITKPFVILTGISGSGKSKIAQVFAEIISDDSCKSYELIPVKPNWRDNKSLFGYHNLIDNSYYITPMIQLFLRALKYPEKPFFLILDEMNIAKTEHYFADYLSLIESRRSVKKKRGSTLSDLQEVFNYPAGTTLSEAIILAAIDINKPEEELMIREYRENRFSELWKNTIWTGSNWTAQFRSELNQGDGRLAHRVFEGGDGKYKLKNKENMTEDDRRIVERLEKMYTGAISKGVSVVQDNIVLHNSVSCLTVNGSVCMCTSCPYKNSEKYKCDKLYDEKTEQYFIPAELPIPLNIFTIGTVNVDETTYMFSPKVLDRSNVIEFNEVDFAGLYNIPQSSMNVLNGVGKSFTDVSFYFDAGTDIPKVKLTIPSKECVNRFISDAGEQFETLISIFAILKKYNLHFGYRVMNEISCYMCNVFDNTSYINRNQRALDNQILQKILPKLYGSFDKIWYPLIEVLGTLLKTPQKINVDDGDGLIDSLKKISADKITSLEINTIIAEETFAYPKSAIKIMEMLSDLNDVGYATFIK